MENQKSMFAIICALHVLKPYYKNFSLCLIPLTRLVEEGIFMRLRLW